MQGGAAASAAGLTRGGPSSPRLTGEIVWQGMLVLVGDNSSHHIQCSAAHHRVPGRLPVVSANLWPAQLLLHRTRLLVGIGVLPQLQGPTTQWLVRFIGTDGPATACLQSLAIRLARRGIAAELPIPGGALFIFAQDAKRLPGDPAMRGVAGERAVLLAAFRPSAIPPPTPPNAETRVWAGSLSLRDGQRCTTLHAAALRLADALVPSMHAAARWPPVFIINTARLRTRELLWDALKPPGAQWYVRIVALDSQCGQEVNNDKLQALVEDINTRQLVGEVPCVHADGTLFLLANRFMQHGLSLIGVFRPNASPDRIGDHEF